MAQASWPSPAHNSHEVTDVEYEQLAARFSDDGTYGTPSDTAVVSAGTGLSVDIRADVVASVRGHAWTSGTTGDTLAIAANPTGATRIDWVVLRLDRSTWTVRAAIVAGTAGAGAPALTQDTGDTGLYEIPLAKVSVQAGAASVTVTRAEQYVGLRTRPCTSTTRNPHPVPGETCYETDTGIMRLWSGSAWHSVFDDSGSIIINVPNSAWDTGTESVLEKRNGIVCLRLGSFQRAASTLTSGSTSRLPVTIPSAYRHATRDQYVLCYVTGLEIGRITIYSKASDKAGQVWLTQHPAISAGENVLAQSGVSWAVD